MASTTLQSAYCVLVIAKCGHPKSTPGGQPPTKRPHSVKVSRLLPPPNAKSDAKLSSKLEMLMRNLVASKGFFAQLPDTICNSDKYAPLDDRQCWNGLSLGRGGGERGRGAFV
ncbi:hypothetical protein CAPTEDRAFT_215230 [Capitella teleta]|uniref:Uncharacterized protein n=1 Tax=Capitella teleta TaxID=283909 RepID=R7VKK5_CAPTE|nr:hypothetical protein CAPTEDRAFT_215230 [Capitella teleta]|eukprot:ELU17456.1 hypothetical protein CAPTEDRAFT_215230 [Capitella teleta]